MPSRSLIYINFCTRDLSGSSLLKTHECYEISLHPMPLRAMIYLCVSFFYEWKISDRERILNKFMCGTRHKYIIKRRKQRANLNIIWFFRNSIFSRVQPKFIIINNVYESILIYIMILIFLFRSLCSVHRTVSLFKFWSTAIRILWRVKFVIIIKL